MKSTSIMVGILCLICVAIAGSVAEASLTAPEAVYYDAKQDQANRNAYFQGVPVNYQSLNTLLTQTHLHHLSYDVARKTWLYPTVDRHPDGKLRGIYTNVSFDALETMLDPYNCEHSVPQSWFGEKSPMKADLHHLFTAEMKCNSYRNNHPYGQEQKIVNTRAGCGKVMQATPNVFEPDHNKGAAARATLYFLVRYPGYITTARLTYDSLDTIIGWAKASPPSIWELHRNAGIYVAQGNRNPFIDYPAWIDKIDFTQGYGNSVMA